MLRKIYAFSDYVNDPIWANYSFLVQKNPNEKYRNAVLIDSVLDHFDAPESSLITEAFLKTDLSIKENLDQVLSQMRLITKLPIPSEIPLILQTILSAGGRDQYIRPLRKLAFM